MAVAMQKVMGERYVLGVETQVAFEDIATRIPGGGVESDVLGGDRDVPAGPRETIGVANRRVGIQMLLRECTCIRNKKQTAKLRHCSTGEQPLVSTVANHTHKTNLGL